MRRFPGRPRTRAAPPASGSGVDGLASRFHRQVVLAHPLASLLVAIGVYGLGVWLTAPLVGVSSNFLVVLPVVTGALAYALPGGIIAGAMGLPANCLLYALMGHPEYEPASLLMAELSGLILGATLGFLADYFTVLETEIARRRKIEDSLRRALEDKEVLLRELHHRVRNNLNIVKSIIQLQRNRSRDPEFLSATEDLTGRVFAIALVHDRLSGMLGLKGVDPRGYLSSLAAQIVQALGPETDGPGVYVDIPEDCPELDPDRASIIGIIANEAITNAAKHAFRNQGPGSREPAIVLSYHPGDDWITFTIEDNGVGIPEGRKEGLGFRLMKTMARQLGGTVVLGARIRPRAALGDDPRLLPGELGLPGTRMEFEFPRQDPRQSE